MNSNLSDYYIDTSSTPDDQITVYGMVTLRHKEVVDYVCNNSKQSVVDSWQKVMKQITVEELQEITSCYKVNYVNLEEYINYARLFNRMTIEHGFDELQEIVAPFIKQINENK